MTQYYIAEKETVEDLMKQVNGLLSEGWKLQGGVSHSRSEYSYDNERKGYQESVISDWYAQAMVKE